MMTDPSLEALVHELISARGGEFSVSLLVSGTWLAGMAITPRSWFEQLAQRVDAAMQDTELGNSLRASGRVYAPSHSEIEAGVVESRPLDRLEYVHLRDARTGNPPDYETPGFLVRCRVADVSAWVLGLVGTTAYTPPRPKM